MFREALHSSTSCKSPTTIWYANRIDMVPARRAKMNNQSSTYVKADICLVLKWGGKIPFEPVLAHKGPDSSENMKDCRTFPGTASRWWNNLETQQPILWSDEYLTVGGVPIPSVLSQQAHMVPCYRRLQQ